MTTCSTIAVPSSVMRSASQRGTRPPCNGKSAVPERFTLLFSLIFRSLDTGRRPRLQNAFTTSRRGWRNEREGHEREGGNTAETSGRNGHGGSIAGHRRHG